MDHLAIPVADRERSRRVYATYFGFDARPPHEYADGVLMIYNAAGFALALGQDGEPIARPGWMHFGVGLRDRDAVVPKLRAMGAPNVRRGGGGTAVRQRRGRR